MEAEASRSLSLRTGGSRDQVMIARDTQRKPVSKNQRTKTTKTPQEQGNHACNTILRAKFRGKYI